MDLNEIFDKIGGLSVAVVGDFCLDVYWEADMKRSVLSRETPHYPLPVISERMSAGGAGNVAVNIAALKPKKVSAVGVTGADWRADALINCLADAGVNTDGLFRDAQRVTNCYIKPLRHGHGDVVYEDPRLDFENYSALSSDTEEKLITLLDESSYDVICVCDQMLYGCITPSVRKKICNLGAGGRNIIVDSRDRAQLYTDVIIKPNEVEALAALGKNVDYEQAAKELSAKTKKPVIITLGADGCIVYENDSVKHVSAFRAEPPLDICGAGDTFLSAAACVYGTGEALSGAALIANAASNVTVRKLHTTGTASREEIAGVLEGNKVCL